MSSEDLLVDAPEVAVENAAETAETAEIEPVSADQEGGAAETKEAVEEQEIDFSKPPPRVNRPDKSQLLSEVEQLQKEISELQAAQQVAQKELTALTTSNSGTKSESEQARAILQQLNNERQRIFAERQALIAQKKSSQDEVRRGMAESQAMRAEVKYSSTEAVDEEIAKLEARQQRVSMSLSEEKKLLKQIADLKQSRKMVSQIAEQKASLEQVRLSRAQLDKQIDEKNAELKAVHERLDAQREILNNLYAGSQSNKDKYPEIRKRINELRAQIREKHATIKRLRDEFREKEQAFFKNRDVWKKYRDYQKKQDAERRKAEQEAYEKALEEEEAKKIPYEAEINLCDHLVSYLEHFLVPSSAEAADANASPAHAELEVNGQVLRAYRRDDDDEVSKKKKGKKNKKQHIAGVKHDKIVHSVDTLATFAALAIAPPTTVQNVPACVEAVREKKAFYQSQPRGAVPTLRETAKAEAERAKAQKNTKKGKQSEELEFPDIPGIRTDVVVRPSASNFAAAVLTGESAPAVANGVQDSEEA